jgi:hypothetical protein
LPAVAVEPADGLAVPVVSVVEPSLVLDKLVKPVVVPEVRSWLVELEEQETQVTPERRARWQTVELAETVEWVVAAAEAAATTVAVAAEVTASRLAWMAVGAEAARTTPASLTRVASVTQPACAPETVR